MLYAVWSFLLRHISPTNIPSGHIYPIIDRLSSLHNFTIESQVQFHAPLAFLPQTLDDKMYGLTPEDLTVFINSAEWTLCERSFLGSQVVRWSDRPYSIECFKRSCSSFHFVLTLKRETAFEDLGQCRQV